MDYAKKHKIVLEINDKNIHGDYPLVEAVCNDNYYLVDKLIDYAEKNDIVLKMDRKSYFQ